MTSPPPILVYGRDRALLETRGWVLEHAGFPVFCAIDLPETLRLATTEPIGLFVLCHSLSPEETERALFAVAALRPEIKRLLMTANTPLGPTGGTEETLSAFDGPRALIDVAKMMLGTH